MPPRIVKIAPFLFFSGMCALIYQTAWLRELRLVFGASTPASAAVLAIFMGGLGVGGVVLGRRAEAQDRPLAYYARLELFVAATTAVTPLLVKLVRVVYASLGGTGVLGMAGGTVVRLLLSVLVLAAPTVLMGGTLPAAARAAETEDDVRRRGLAVLYGVNTLGAVFGAALSTFLLLEIFGTSLTLWIACLVNALVAVLARAVDRGLTYEAPPAVPVAPELTAAEGAPPKFVLLASSVVGFAFLLMELVWYRMLAPLLGGSLYTFGLILAVALLGIGLGGGAYALLGRDRAATVRGFALTCTIEALCLAVPYALGDRIALLTIFLRPFGAFGFYGHVAAWTAVTAIVVLPAAIVSGIQFPMLIALLGRGRANVARHIGLAYAANTAGAIVGSLAGGFGLLPLLSATGTWRFVIVVLALLGAAAIVLALRQGERWRALLLPAAAGATALLLLRALGPTAAWRHSPIGAGRADRIAHEATSNSLRAWLNHARSTVQWEADGLEASVALERTGGFAFVVNGKSDGEARGDAHTQVMGGLIGSYLHPHPTSALVIGLGTGSTAGWLAAVPSIERVDAVELEGAIVRVARDCAPVNHDALDNPKLHVSIGDARETLLTTRQRYDIIFSEPSNPYRAGVSSLFTQEHLRATAARLAEGGIFLQFLQAYEIDAQSVKTAYATVASVFPFVHTWHTGGNDLILMASLTPIRFDVPRLRARADEEPYRSAFRHVWRVSDLEGVLAHYTARPTLARAVAIEEGPSAITTDDRNLLEFGFARSVGKGSLFSLAELEELSVRRGEDMPELTGGDVDVAAILEQRADIAVVAGSAPAPFAFSGKEQKARFDAKRRHATGQFAGVLAAWAKQAREPVTPLEHEIVAEALVASGDEASEAAIEQLRALFPVEADALLGRLRLGQGRLAEAASALSAAFVGYRNDPWADPAFMLRSLETALELGNRDPSLARRMYDALAMPFAVHMLDSDRQRTALRLALHADFKGLCAQAIGPFEPYVPWEEWFLVRRSACYQAVHDPRAADAEAELREYFEGVEPPFSRDLEPLPPARSHGSPSP